MRKRFGRSRGFTLIASLLVLLLLSALAIGLLFMVHGAGQIGSNDLETNVAYYGAESGMELLTANLAALYQSSQSPTPAQLTNLTNNPPDPTMVGSMNYVEKISWTPDANGNPQARTSIISSGPSEGLMAEIIPLTLQVTATRPGGASVNMTRGVEVALIPVFQFGVFSDSDLSYFPGPRFDFQGRVHSNGNLFLATGGGPLVIDAKVTAVKEIIRDRLANGWPTSSNYNGSVYIPNANGGCDPAAGAENNPNGSCVKFAVTDASWSGGIPAAGGPNGNWPNVASSYNGFVKTGINPLRLPFVQGNSTQQIQIVRKRPDATEAESSPLGSSREYNKANIRILLADTVAALHPDRGTGPLGDGQDVDLVVGPAPGAPLVVPITGTANSTALAWADSTLDGNWKRPANETMGNGATTWPLIKGVLRVEYKNAAGNWIGITNEWLRLGFARGLFPPTTPKGGGGQNTVHPNAILILQQLADRDAIAPFTADAPSNTIEPNSQNSWYPINLYDPREGFPRDAVPPGLANPQCYANGVMNAVELDVGNLRQWLLGGIPGSGQLVEFTSQNGYLVYFSDRRGMLVDQNTNPKVLTGEYGFEDVINSASPLGTPDGGSEPSEDVDGNTLTDNWGAANVGDAFPPNLSVTNPYQPLNCSLQARQNRVTGARHVLKLVDGSLNSLPTRPDNNQGGFTVASENPVYVQGNYNSDATDPFWGNPDPKAPDIPHAAAAVIADAVTLLSNNWSDLNSLVSPLNLGGRKAATTYYRMAIAGGKNINFPQPAGTGQDFGTDGGVHNFLRYIETWGGSTLFYRGSLVSLYYSQYATGTFKCCTLVYSPPTRAYYFDTQFLNPTSLPPGTPMLQDVVNLTYWQDFKPY
jgi:hypothetical protein